MNATSHGHPITEADETLISNDIQNALDPERDIKFSKKSDNVCIATTITTNHRKDNRTHYIKKDDDGQPIECSCKGFAFHDGDCRHITALKIATGLIKPPNVIKKFQTNGIENR